MMAAESGRTATWLVIRGHWRRGVWRVGGTSGCLRLLLLLNTLLTLATPTGSSDIYADKTDRQPTESKRTVRDDEMSDEKRLINTLLGGYTRIGKGGRPVRNSSTSVTVMFGLGLIQMDLHEKAKILSMSMWTRYQWRDEYLSWDPADYNGVSAIRLESDLIWIPDIMLYNTADVDIEARDALAVISHNGLVNWYPHCIFRSSCSVDVSNFPFDEQQCHMWFGSWTYSSKEVDLNMAYPGGPQDLEGTLTANVDAQAVDTRMFCSFTLGTFVFINLGIDLSTFRSDHKESSGWHVLNVTAQKQLMPSEDEEPNFAVLTFNIYMKRKMVFSTYMLTLPCVFLACLSLVVFWLPPERPDRTALAMSSFASFMVLLLILVEAAMPTASSVPTLGVYYCFNMVIIMVAIILSSVVVNVARGDPVRRAPKWLVLLTIHVLARLLCITSVRGFRYTDLRNTLRPSGSSKRSSKPPRYHHHNALTDRQNGDVGGGSGSILTAGESTTYKSLETTELVTIDTPFANRRSVPVDDCTTSSPRGGGGGGGGSGSGSGSGSCPRGLGEFSTVDSPTPASPMTTATSSAPHTMPILALEQQVTDIKQSIQRIESKMEEKAQKERQKAFVMGEWKACALVLDRFFFLLYLMLIVVSLAVLFPRPKEGPFSDVEV